jgi:hypothetical protein
MAAIGLRTLDDSDDDELFRMTSDPPSVSMAEALTLFLTIIQVRPLYARVANDNLASRRVLEKAGFRQVGTEVSYAAARHTEIEESILGASDSSL